MSERDEILERALAGEPLRPEDQERLDADPELREQWDELRSLVEDLEAESEEQIQASVKALGDPVGGEEAAVEALRQEMGLAAPKDDSPTGSRWGWALVGAAAAALLAWILWPAAAELPSDGSGLGPVMLSGEETTDEVPQIYEPKFSEDEVVLKWSFEAPDSVVQYTGSITAVDPDAAPDPPISLKKTAGTRWTLNASERARLPNPFVFILRINLDGEPLPPIRSEPFSY